MKHSDGEKETVFPSVMSAKVHNTIMQIHVLVVTEVKESSRYETVEV